jgi:hypothetical protein
MKIKIIFTVVCFYLLSIQNIFGQNKIETLKQITLQDGSDLIESLGHYRMASLFDDYSLKKKEPSRNSDIDTLELYWEVLNTIAAYNPKSYEEQREISYFLPQLLTDIIKDFGDQQYEELTKIYKSLPDTSYLRGESFLVPFVQYQVYKEIKQIIEDKIKPSHYLSDSIISFDEITKQKKLECINKYKLLFNSVKNHYQQRVLSDTSCGWFSVQYNERLFYKTIEEILFNSSIDDFKNLNKFRWGGWCGTGSEYFYSKQLLVELLILLREKDYLSILGRADYYSGPNLSGKTKIKLLELCNIDWIDYYTGSILSDEFNSIPSFFTKAGDKSALNLFDFRDSITNKGWYIVKCAEFINPDSEIDRDYFDFFDDNQFLQNYEYSLPFNIIPVNHEIKNKLKQEIIDVSSKADEFNLCQFSIDALTKIKFDGDVKNALLSLTKSRFSMIRNNAANILKKKGVVVELPKDDGKIKFKFLVNGKPLKQDIIRCEFYKASKLDRPFLNNSEKTNEEGILSITSDLILDHVDEIKKIVFYPDKSNGGGKEVIFVCESVLPNNLNDTTTIDIQPAKVSVKFHLNRNTDFYIDKKMNVNAFPPKVMMLDFNIDIKDFFVFPMKFQKKMKCSFSAYIPGSTTWHSSLFEIQEDSILLDAYLKNGTNVTFNIVPPGGKDADKWVLFDLVKTGNSEWDNFWNYDYSISGYESLPIGEYNLIISSSAEKKSKYQKSENECSEQIIAEFPDYNGKIIPFTISKDSPPEIDLGIIKLEPVK